MDKRHILNEIKRTALANEGHPLGLARFTTATGIKESDWRGKYWENFGDAQVEAGFSRNTKTVAHDENLLMEKLVGFIRERKRFPTMAALRMKRRADASFPSPETFDRFGETKLLRIEAVRQYCASRQGYEDVVAICDAAKDTNELEADGDSVLA